MDEITPQMAAEEQLRRNLLPADWKWLLVRGKEAFGQGTSTDPLSTEKTLEKVKSRRHRQTGLGVVTGEASGGLVAVDIDGPHADALLKEHLDAAWPDPEKPGTMSWRGRPGRRQLLYQVPKSIQPLVSEFTKAEFIPVLKGTDEECCIRYNGCYSVIPGSKHPNTKKRYEWIDYNDGNVSEAPGWIVEFMLEKVKKSKPKEAHSYIPTAYLELHGASTDFTYRQMRRHFWMEGGLKDKLLATDDGFCNIFYTSVWDYQPLTIENEEKGTLVGGCPFHDSNSGKSFTLWENLNWYCHKEGVGGDALQLLHALRTGDINAGNPPPVVLQNYLQEIADYVGEKYPEDYREVQKIKEEKKYDPLTGPPLLVAAREIINTYRNTAVATLELLQLASDYGVRQNADELRLLLQEDEDYKRSGEILDHKARKALLTGTDWLIPDVLKRPSTILLHGDGGCGKSLACLVLAKHVGRGLPFKVRGAEMPVKQGPVLWCNADQSLETLEEQLEAQGIENDSWFHTDHTFRFRDTHRLAEKLKKLKPVLVIIDSLGASQPTVDGNKQIISSPLYWLETNNGITFPKCTFIVIHHNNKQGGFRGHSSIRDACSETWAISKPTDQEMEANEWGEDTFRRRKITIGKSRSGREGEELVSILQEDFSMDLEDFTPIQRFRPGGSISVLDRVHFLVREMTKVGNPLKRSEIETMVNADGGKRASTSAVRQSLRRLVNRDLLLCMDAPSQSRTSGSLEKVFVAKTEKGISLARGEGLERCITGEDPSQAQEIPSDTPQCYNADVSLEKPTEGSSDSASVPEQIETDATTHVECYTQKGVSLGNPVTATDLVSDTHFGGNREPTEDTPQIRQPMTFDGLMDLARVQRDLQRGPQAPIPHEPVQDEQSSIADDHPNPDQD